LIDIVKTPLAGAVLMDIKPIVDERGFFARTYCEEELHAAGIPAAVCQCSVSFNESVHTLRGLHFQRPPSEEDKIVRCTSGSIYDVIVDIRHDSGTLGKWFAAELSAENRRSLFIPKGFAHGFLTLSARAEVLYMMSVPFAPGAAGGLRWDDPLLAIDWPARPAVISQRDASYPLLRSLNPWSI
jgi:dTDP-4-dehydrorhamnose 3,5-epimerase